MYFASASDLVSMSGHGFYVWLAFGFSFAWLTYLLINPIIKKNKVLKNVFVQQQIEKIATHQDS